VYIDAGGSIRHTSTNPPAVNANIADVSITDSEYRSGLIDNIMSNVATTTFLSAMALQAHHYDKIKKDSRMIRDANSWADLPTELTGTLPPVRLNRIDEVRLCVLILYIYYFFVQSSLSNSSSVYLCALYRAC
jgi:hypothetical protein